MVLGGSSTVPNIPFIWDGHNSCNTTPGHFDHFDTIPWAGDGTKDNGLVMRVQSVNDGRDVDQTLQE